MPKNSKTPPTTTTPPVTATKAVKTKKAAVAAPAAPVVAAVATAKVTAPVVTSVEQPVVVSTSEPQTGGDVVELVGFEQAFKDVVSHLTTQMSSLKTVLTDVRKLEKRVQKELREAKKGRRRRKPLMEGGEKAKRAPSGFAKPSELSDELCGFLGVESGTMMARTEVTKHITKYIRDHELQDPSYKRRILCDPALGSLLKVTNTDEVTYFNLQSFMKPHFPKSLAVIAAAAAAAAAATDTSVSASL